MNDVSASRLLPAVVGGVLSFVIGSYMLSVSQIVVPSEGAGRSIRPPKRKTFRHRPTSKRGTPSHRHHFEQEGAESQGWRAARQDPSSQRS